MRFFASAWDYGEKHLGNGHLYNSVVKLGCSDHHRNPKQSPQSQVFLFALKINQEAKQWDKYSPGHISKVPGKHRYELPEWKGVFLIFRWRLGGPQFLPERICRRSVHRKRPGRGYRNATPPLTLPATSSGREGACGARWLAAGRRCPAAIGCLGLFVPGSPPQAGCGGLGGGSLTAPASGSGSGAGVPAGPPPVPAVKPEARRSWPWDPGREEELLWHANMDLEAKVKKVGGSGRRAAAASPARDAAPWLRAAGGAHGDRRREPAPGLRYPRARYPPLPVAGMPGSPPNSWDPGATESRARERERARGISPRLPASNGWRCLKLSSVCFSGACASPEEKDEGRASSGEIVTLLLPVSGSSTLLSLCGLGALR